jgi:hypothetical protein
MVLMNAFWALSSFCGKAHAASTAINARLLNNGFIILLLLNKN